MKRILSFFVPHRLDAIALIMLLFIAGLFWAVESADYFAPWYGLNRSDHLTVIAFFSFSCLALLATGVSAGWGRSSSWRSILLIVVCCAACIACYFALNVFEVDKSTYEIWYGDIGSTNRLPPPNKSLFLHMFWALPLALIGGFLSVLVIRKLPRLFSKTSTDRFTLSRQKILVIAACCLFVIAMGSRAAGALQFGSGRNTGEFLPILLLNLAVAVAAFVVAIILPSWIVLVNKNWMWKMILAVVATLLIGLASWQGYFYVQNTRGGYEVAAQIGITVISGIVFLLALIGLKRNPDPEESATDTLRQTSLFPTIWTMLILSVATGVTLVGWLTETTILVSDPLDSYTWQRARLAKKYLAPSGSRVTHKVVPQSVNIWNFSDSADKDVLKIFDDVNDGQYALMVNLKPDIDTTPIAGVTKQIAIQNSRINVKQLADLWSNAIGYVSFSSVDVLGEPASKISAPGVSGISILTDKAGAVSKLIDAISTNSLRIQVQSYLHAEDFESVAIAAQNSDVFLPRGMDLDVPVTAKTPSLKNISVWVRAADYSELVEAFAHPILLETDIRVRLQNSLDYSAEQFWDMYFATDGRVNMWYAKGVEVALEEFDFDVASRRCHWGFGFDENDKVDELFLPNSDYSKSISTQSQLKTLSFDAGWLNGRMGGMSINPTKFSHLKNLINLERLYFSPGAATDSLEFLGSMTKLKHLQIRQPKRPLKGLSGFDVCQSLESLTLFEVPNKQTMAELKRLPNLKRFTVVDSQNEVLGPKKLVARLQKIIPQCEVSVLEFGAHFSEIPQSFLDHKERTKTRLMKKLFERDE